MTEQHDAVVLILDRLKTEGLEWYRGAKAEDVDLFERRISGNFSIFEGGEIYTIGRKPAGSFPAKKILVMPPSGREQEAILGLWLRWNFEADPFEFRVFLGLWSQIDGEKTFIAFRFEAPEQGDEHNYYPASRAETLATRNWSRTPHWSHIDFRQFRLTRPTSLNSRCAL